MTWLALKLWVLLGVVLTMCHNRSISGTINELPLHGQSWFVVLCYVVMIGYMPYWYLRMFVKIFTK